MSIWLSFWKPRDRFSLDYFRHVIDQLMKVQTVNEDNKDTVIETLRSIAELITYGDQHDAAYFEFFMEKQVISEFVRILKNSSIEIVSIQLLQTMSIMIQNLKSDHSIYYLFSNEYVNSLVTYSFDFKNEELLSYYISFLRAISGKLNKDTISLLFKTRNDEVVSFPLYVEAIRFAFDGESMIRTAVRALTLNIYHVGDNAVNNFVSRAPHADYFIRLIEFFRDQCVELNALVSKASHDGLESTSSIVSAIDEIEDHLYYFSDVVSAGIPDVGRLIMDNILGLLVFPLILPSLTTEAVSETGLGAVTSLYLLCCILRILKIKDLANIVAAALLCHTETFTQNVKTKLNGEMLPHDFANAGSDNAAENDHIMEFDSGGLGVNIPASSSSQSQSRNVVVGHDHRSTECAPREALLSFVTRGDEVLVSGSLSLMATLLQTKELDESMVDALGILPERKQHKKKLLKALVGEDSEEEQLFDSESSLAEDCINGELDFYMQKLKDYYGVSCANPEVGPSPRVHRFQVLDTLVSLFCRSNISAEILWDGGWLLRQLLLYSETGVSSHHLRLLKESLRDCNFRLLEETTGTWSDLLVTVFSDEWRKCKRAIEASSPRKHPKSIIMPAHKFAPDESSFAAGERMCEKVKVFVLLHHLHMFMLGRVLPDQPPIHASVNISESSRAKSAGLHQVPKPSAEISLVDAVPCRIAFERGKERYFQFLPVSIGSSGWLVLAEELVMKEHRGIVKVAAPLPGCNPRVDEKHPKWLHLRIRLSSFPFTDAAKYTVRSKIKSKALVDGRWTLAFKDEESCKLALCMILEETKFQNTEVEKLLKPLLEMDTNSEYSNEIGTSSEPSNLQPIYPDIL